MIITLLIAVCGKADDIFKVLGELNNESTNYLKFGMD